MSDLRSFVVLQARLYEFLEQQDETTLQAIVSGAVRLAVLPAADAQVSRQASAGLTMAPSREPFGVAQDLSRLASEQERRIYLNATKLPVKGLREVANLLGLVGYSKLTRIKLVDLLVGHGPDQTETLAGKTGTSAPSSLHPVDSDSEAEPHAAVQEARPAPGTAKSDADVATIASRLREIETEEEGAEYINAQHLAREDLLAVAAELQLTRVNRLSQTELEKRVLRQAIGARRKFAGLRRW